MSRSRLAVVASAELTVRAFLVAHLAGLQRCCDVTVFVNTDNPRFLDEYGLGVPVIAVGIERRVRLLADLRAVVALYRRFRGRQFDAVYSITPKAGLLAMVAAWLARVPVRMHTFTGQVWATRSGMARTVLRHGDRTIATAATHVLVDSGSQREFLIAEGVVDAAKSSVLAHGSICGVDAGRFRPNPDARAGVRDELGIGEQDPVILFVGRLNRDKGILDLTRAFIKLREEGRERLHLLVIGPDEEGMTVRMRQAARTHAAHLHFVPFTTVPERYMAASDVYCLPSYREGFGMALLEAAAAGLPGVGSRIYGITDAISEGVTGLLHEVGDVSALSRALAVLLDDPDRRMAMGRAARDRAVREFQQEVVTGALVGYVQRALQI